MRLPTGGRIDRSKPLRFTFDGRSLSGLEGDTLASALLANDVHLVGRSFKYHRPRGILGAGVEEPNALVGVTRGPGRFEPNARATTLALYDGLEAESQNRWPSLPRDLGGLNSLISRFIPAGFYYKTFMWPRGAWHRLYEPQIRRMAGLGRATDTPDPDRYAQRWAHAELLIVGGGPAGLAAALAAAPSGKRIILCDQDEAFGGALLGEPQAAVDGKPARDWIEGVLAELACFPNVRLLPRTTAFGYGLHNMVALAERLADHLPGIPTGARERKWLVRAERVVLATGSIERPLPFPDNDRPGVMLASAARTYANRYAVLLGRNAAVCVAHDSGYDAAFDLAAAGARVTIVDLRSDQNPALVARAQVVGIEVLGNHAPAGTRGKLRVAALGVARRDGVSVGAPTRWIDCDLVMMAGGWTPSIHLFSQSRGVPAWSEALQAYVPGKSAQAEESAGAARGNLLLDDCLADGHAAGRRAVGLDAPARTPANSPGGIVPLVELPTFADGDAKAFVDFQNDVTANDIALAIREGFRSVEHIKRYTTNGMATDQGRTSNLTALAISSQQQDQSVPQAGITTFRAPFTPVTFGMMAGYTRGELFDPVRRTPTHDWAAAAGAVFEDVGQWKRARYFPRAGEDMYAAVNRECLAVRGACGMFDASTLGKIEVVGPDAAAFMNLMYTNSWTKLGIGRCRYGVMLREDGFILDDGVVGRLADDRFHVTTTSGGAAGVLHMMEDFRQTEFPHLKVWLTSTTEQWAVIALNGPRAREILAPFVDLDISREAMPHMSVRDGHFDGIPMRLFRVSFTGELGFEINVPPSRATEVWRTLHEAGGAHGLTPYGTESMHVLRAEKGYIIIGQETDGTVTPGDAGLGWAIGKAKPDFVGKRSLDRPAMHEPDRKQLVGLRPADGATVIEEGAQIVASLAVGERAIGHVSSSYWSANCSAPIALALVKGGRERIGGRVHVALPTGAVAMEVVDPVFVDPEGTRLDG